MEDKNYLMEAFKEFDALNEEVFDISIEDGFQKAKEFKDAVVDDFEPVVVIDDTVENEEDVETSYVGKVILQCPTCLSMVYRDPEDVIIDEELEIANVGDVCPTCQSEDGFKIIGEVSDFEDEECTCEDGECTCKDKEEIKVDDVDSIDDEADYFNGEDEEELKEALPNNIKIVKTFKDKDDGRTHVIAYRPSDNTYIVGLGYNKEQDRWGQGKYDFKSMEDAVKYLKANYEVTIDVKESVSKDLIDEFAYEYGISKAEAKKRLAGLSKEEQEKKLNLLRRGRKINAKAELQMESSKRDDIDANRDYKLKRKGLKESKRLNESVYSEVQEFLKDATKYFKDTEEGCYYMPITTDLYLVAGCPSNENTPYVKIAFNSDDLQSDYEYDWYMPTYTDGETASIEISLRDNDLERDATYLVKEAQSMQKEIDKGNLLLESCSAKKLRIPNRAKLKESVKRWRTQKSLKEDKDTLNPTTAIQKDIERAKRKLKGKNPCENFGEKEIRELESKYSEYKYGQYSNAYSLIGQFAEWCGNYTGANESIKSRRKVRVSKEDKINEDFNKVDIETDREKMSMTADENGKVTVTTEPIENVKPEGEGEMIVPISDETKEKFKTTEEEKEYVDVDFDEFEEKDFDSLGESYLKNVYENVKSFNTTKGEISGNTLKLEGVIKFKSGKTVKTGFVFEAKSVSKNGKLKFIGENLQITKRQPAFTLIGSVEGKKLCCESLAYKYNVATQEGKSQRVKGVVTR